MGKKTYIPSLIIALKYVCTYAVRWQSQLRTYLPPEAIPLLEDVLEACEALLAVIDVPPVHP